MGELRGWRNGEQGFYQKDRWGPTRGATGKYGRPPSYPGSSHQSVPQWEKNFCVTVGKVPWRKLCQTKELIHMYPAVINWNDSAAEEAFHNAKARYWSRINDFSSDVPEPDPDMYIDVVDHDAFLDPELVEDLNRPPPPPPPSVGESDPHNSLNAFMLSDLEVPSTGWDDEEDKLLPIQPTGWGDAEDQLPTNAIQSGPDHVEEQIPNCENFDKLFQIQPSGWDDVEDQVPINNTTTEPDKLPAPERMYRRKRGGCGRFGLRCTNPSSQGKDHYNNRSNCRGRNRTAYNYEQAPLPSRQGNSISCYSSINYQNSSDSRGTWQWQKSIY